MLNAKTKSYIPLAIAIVMLILTVVLFFVPNFCINYSSGESISDSNYTTISAYLRIYNFEKFSIDFLVPCILLITLFIATLIFAIICIPLSKKYKNAFSFHIIFLIFYIVEPIYITVDCEYCSLYVGTYLALIFILILVFFILYLNNKLTLPKRKPTKAERISALEAQVENLLNEKSAK